MWQTSSWPGLWPPRAALPRMLRATKALTSSCCEVKGPAVATQRRRLDVATGKSIAAGRPQMRAGQEMTTMLGKVWHGRRAEPTTGGEPAPECLILPEEPMSLEKVRAVAIGAALAVSVDTSPAVLLNIQAYAERPRRQAPPDRVSSCLLLFALPDAQDRGASSRLPAERRRVSRRRTHRADFPRPSPLSRAKRRITLRPDPPYAAPAWRCRARRGRQWRGGWRRGR